MEWVLLSLIGACCDTAYYASIKHYLRDVSGTLIAAGSFLVSGAGLFALSAFRGFPDTGPLFIIAVAASSVLNVIAALLYLEALASTDLSLSHPMISFTPVFLIGTSYLILGEWPGTIGMAGIVLITAGSYLLNTTAEKEGLLAPFKRMFRTRGVVLMLLVALIFSVCANVDKVVILNSDTTFGAACTLLIAGTIFALMSAMPRRGRHLTDPIPLFPFVVIGCILILEVLAINVALTMQIVPYVISLKRTSILFSVLAGALVFREAHIGRRFLGSVVMVAGVACIVLFS